MVRNMHRRRPSVHHNCDSETDSPFLLYWPANYLCCGFRHPLRYPVKKQVQQTGQFSRVANYQQRSMRIFLFLLAINRNNHALRLSNPMEPATCWFVAYQEFQFRLTKSMFHVKRQNCKAILHGNPVQPLKSRVGVNLLGYQGLARPGPLKSFLRNSPSDIPLRHVFIL